MAGARDREVPRCVHCDGNQVQKSRAALELNNRSAERRACEDGVELRASRCSAGGGQEAKGGSSLKMLMGDGATFAWRVFRCRMLGVQAGPPASIIHGPPNHRPGKYPLIKKIALVMRYIYSYGSGS